MLGELVGNYEVKEKLAEGGMGAVYRAQHKLIDKAAAVKVLLPELSSNREIVDRFFNEAKAATAVRHPGIVEIFDFGYLPNGMAFIVMELLDGEPLSRRLATLKRLPEAEALALTRGIASALSAAHDKGIVHRDLKPDNVFLVPDPDMPSGERPKLLDFGIAKVAEAQRGEASKTRTGAVMGTPTYMSPEQCKGAGKVDHRSDLYAVGCILYEMLTGRPPFVAEGIGELLAAQMFSDPDPPRSIVPEISATTEQLCLALLNKEPVDRVQTARELMRFLGHTTPQRMSTAGMPVADMPPPVKTATRTGTARKTPLPGTGVLATPTAPPTTSPTTLTGSAGEATPAAAKANKRLLFAAVAGAVLVGGIVFAIVSMGGGNKQSAPATSAETPPPPVIDARAAEGSAAAVAQPVVFDAGGAAAPDDAAATDDAGVAVAPVVDAGVTTTEVTSTDTGKRDRRIRRNDKTGKGTKDGKPAGASTETGTGTGSAAGSGSGTRKRMDRGD